MNVAAWQETAYLFRSPRHSERIGRVNVVFSPQACEDYLHWQTADRAVLKRINRLITDAWSRRITEEHRLVYRVVGDDLQILQARYRY